MYQMQLDDYNKIIAFLRVKYIKASHIKFAQSVNISDFHQPNNTILLLKKGIIKFENNIVKEGEFLFIPKECKTNITYGLDPKTTLTNTAFNKGYEEFLKTKPTDLKSVSVAQFNQMTFEVTIFDTINFFKTLGIPPFVIKSDKIAKILDEIIQENTHGKEGKNRIISLKSELLTIEIIRYLINNQLFVKQLAINSTYFKDPRLLDLFKYIKKNLSGNLSNKILADVVHVSEDYVSQYFKTLTGINPQDYIEHRRMQLALDLLRVTKKHIRTIGHEIGYKDTAYFCRRFKIIYGMPPGKMRKKEMLINLQ